MHLNAIRSDFQRVSMDRPDGKPRNLYRKLLLREGTWTHPETGQELNFGFEKLSRMAADFRAMVAEGLKIPILSDHRWDEKSGNGWVYDVEHTGEPGASELYGILDLADDAAKRVDQGATRDVSVSIDTVQNCRTGRVWDGVIDETTLTLRPVIESQTGFEKIGEAVGFSYTDSKKRSRKEQAMPNPNDDKEKMDLAKIQTDLAKVQAENLALTQERDTLRTDLAKVTREKEDLSTRVTAIEKTQLESAKKQIDLAFSKAVASGLKPKKAEAIKKLLGLDQAIDLARASVCLDSLNELLGEIGEATEGWPQGSKTKEEIGSAQQGGTNLADMPVEKFMQKHNLL